MKATKIAAVICVLALAASLFHFKELTVGEVKDYCRSKGVIVR